MEKIIKQKKIWIGAAAGVVLLAVLIVAIAAMKGGKDPVYRSIKIVELEGGVSIDRDGVGTLAAAKNMNLVSGDRVTTAENAYVVLCLDTDKYVMLGEAGAMRVVAEGDENRGKTSISLEAGSVLSDIQNPLSEGSSYEIATPNATMSVRGTVFEVKKEDENGGQISVLVYDGSVAVGLDGKEPVLYGAGEYTAFTDSADPEVLVERGTVSDEVLDDKVREWLQQISTEGRTLNVGSADLSASTPAPTATPEVTATPAPTATPEVTATPAPTATPEVTATPAPTATPEVTATPVPTATPEVTATPAPTATPEVTATPAPTATPEVTATPAPTATPVPEPEEDDEEEPEPTPAPTAKPTPAPTATPEVTATPASTATPEVTETPVPTWGPWPWWPTAEPTAAPTVEPTTEPTATPTVEPTTEPTATPTVEPTTEPTAAPTAGPTAEPTTAPTAGPTVEPTTAPTAEPTATPTAAPSATPAPPQEGYCRMSYEIPYVLLSGKEPENADEAKSILPSLVLGPSDIKKGELLNWRQEKAEVTTIPNHEDVQDLGFEFVGWYRINGTDAWNFDTDVIMENMVLYPVWKDKDGNLYKVKVSEELGICYSIKEVSASTPSPAPSSEPSPAPSSEPSPAPSSEPTGES